MKPGDFVVCSQTTHLWRSINYIDNGTSGDVEEGRLGLVITGETNGEDSQNIEYVLCLFGNKFGWIFRDYITEVE